MERENEQVHRIVFKIPINTTHSLKAIAPLEEPSGVFG